jgi:glycerol-3-phosphate acyltransferase PlsX
MKIIVDAFGCDNPEAFISGIPAAITESPSATLVVVGDKARIEAILDGKNFDKERLQIVDAPEVITNEDSPILAIRTKRILLW